MQDHDVTLTEIGKQTSKVFEEILKQVNLKPKQIFVVGCSTSAVKGAVIGAEGSEVIAARMFANISKVCSWYDVYLAVQCCEHLNRALVVEREALLKYNLTEVAVVPALKAGGALAAHAMSEFSNPVVVESIKAHAGVDIGGVLIGMHLREVAVPLKLANKTIGKAQIIAAGTRPKFIGGCRATY
jgi:uncharacterized protein (TIGR01440 family)